LLIGYGLFRKEAAVSSFFYDPVSVNQWGFEGVSPVATAGIKIQNTSNQSFNFYAIAGNVYANNYLIGNISGFTPYTIPKRSQAVVYVKLKFYPLGIVNDIIQAATTNNFSQEIEIEAMANVDNLQIPIKLKYKIGA
jgi:hypothetical protein